MRLPDNILRGAPPQRQIGFDGDALTGGAAKTGPVLSGELARANNEGHQHDSDAARPSRSQARLKNRSDADSQRGLRWVHALPSAIPGLRAQRLFVSLLGATPVRTSH